MTITIKVDKIFSAYMADDSITKTVIDGEIGDEYRKTLWLPGDSVGIAAGYGKPVEKFVQQQYNLFENEIVNENEVNKDRIGNLYYIGQLFGTYLLAQTDDELVLIDQHAAAERINYEKILLELENGENVGYDLLIPFNLEFSTAYCLLINENLETIQKLGIGLEEFGNNSFTLCKAT